MTTGPLPSLLIDIPEGVIDFGWGHPSPRLHPAASLAAAAAQALGPKTAVPLQYGAVQGFGPLLESLAAFLSAQEAYAGLVRPQNLFLTAGASQGIDLAATILARPGDVVLVEEPTYYLIGRIFLDHGLKIVGVPTDDRGLDTGALAAKLESGAIPAPRLLYVIPTYQNPTGSALPLERRRALLELARRHGFTVLADEVYQLMHYGPPPPPPLALLADEATAANVISLGSFSKILAPGLRLGWMQAAPGIIERFVDAGLPVSGGGLNHFAATLAHATLEMGLLGENIERLRQVYGERMQTVADFLTSELADAVSFVRPGGGYFLWLTARADIDTEALLNEARKAGVSYRPGTAFSASGGFRNALRISIALYENDELIEGLRRLEATLRSHQTGLRS